MMARVTSRPHGRPAGPPPSAANTAAATVVLGATMLLTLLLLLLLPDPTMPLLQPRETPGPAAVSEEQQEEKEEEEEEAEEEEEEGEEGWASATRARDFSCVLYDAAFLNCSWRPGPAAPHDVQYYLFTASSSDRDRERECPQYITTATGSWPGSPRGPHTGCHVRDLSAFGSVNYFRVNGSSRQGGHRGPIGVLYTRLSAKQIERFAAPGEVSAWCNATHCRATWSQPRTWVPLHFLDFHYQLRIRNAQDMEDEEEEEEEEEEMKDLVDVASREELAFVFPSPAPRPRQEVRVRAGDVRGPLWSAWSAPALFGSDGTTTPGATIYLVAVLGTLLGGLGLGFCYVRVMRSSAMFVPAIRDKLTDDTGVAVDAHDHDHTTLHVATATGTHGNDDGEGVEEEEEDVLTVQEVTPARPHDPANVTTAATAAAGIQS